MTGRDDRAWDRALSAAATLSPADLGAIRAALAAVGAERRRRERARRLTWTAAAVAVTAVVVVLDAPPAGDVDAAHAYDAYLEASRGW